MSTLIISTSLNPTSRSFLMAKKAASILEKNEKKVTLVDLKELPLPFCDANQCYEHPNVQKIHPLIQQAAAILIAAPIYNYDVSSVCKNLIEVTGFDNAWNHKVVGMMVAATGDRSYLSPLPFMNSLMIDFRCVVAPRFVYASDKDFKEDKERLILNAELTDRIEQLTVDLVEHLHFKTFANA